MTTPLSEIDEVHASLTSTFLSSLSSTKSSSTNLPDLLLSLPYRHTNSSNSPTPSATLYGSMRASRARN
ncbi:hypothetical protein DFP72DRAFT_1083026 [Ephemerocybe angulata]|uniref:Uncharacterized protein n=1 Tax=Ephemerocybe angulata TaxID=980116 RepID=A0A8H6H7G5_9AGAR|nr:hypothetical protein DFP72DRAFT_1083026 [Tulosesus angulatus]